MKYFNRLSDVRDSRKMNKKEFASFLNIPYTTYVGYETGERDPSSDVLKHIAKKCDVSIDFILGAQEEMERLNRVDLNKEELELIELYRMLNRDGRVKSYSYIADLTEMSKYRADAQREKMA